MDMQRNKGGKTGMQVKPDMVEDEAKVLDTENSRMVIKNEPIIKDEDSSSVFQVACGYEECWPSWSNGTVVDEQMSWGSLWLPLWDLNSLGEAYDALYSDVVWEEDIWNLKAIKEVPKHDQKSQLK